MNTSMYVYTTSYVQGILVPNPLKGPEDLETRVPLSVDVNDKLGHVLEAVTLIKKELNGKVGT
jgi:hypothetical protein